MTSYDNMTSDDHKVVIFGDNAIDDERGFLSPNIYSILLPGLINMDVEMMKYRHIIIISVGGCLVSVSVSRGPRRTGHVGTRNDGFEG